MRAVAPTARAGAGAREVVGNRNYVGVQGVQGLALGLRSNRRVSLAFGMAGMPFDFGLIFGFLDPPALGERTYGLSRSLVGLGWEEVRDMESTRYRSQ